MYTVQELLELVSRPASGVTRGRALQMARELSSYQGRVTAAEAAANSLQREFLRALTQDPRFFNAGVAAYRHPFSDGVAARVQRSEGGLSASELAWLDRLPRDPNAVPYDDAIALAGIARTLDRQKHPDDARLLESVAGPVRRVHDRRAAEADVKSAREPLPEIPGGLAAAVSATYAAQHEGLFREDELTGRGSEALHMALSSRRDAWDDRIAAAEAEMQRVRDEDAQRTAVTAP